MDGIIPPKTTGAELRAKNYGADQTGAMVYITLADPAPSGQTINVTRTGYFSFNGTIWQAISTPPLNLPNGTGTVIMIDGEQQIAQEISARMSTNWETGTIATTPLAINNITTKIIDNYNTFTGTSTNNSFTINANGTYLVTMNFSVQPQGNAYSGDFYYGLYNNTDNKWESQLLQTITLADGEVSNLSFNVAMDLVTGKTYSFRIMKRIATKIFIRGELSGNPSTFFSVNRLK
ncbi:hypothetical protein MTQ00_21840 [Chryseobacterium sp. B21-037]|uniref:hypothetical protein n=1 Tax=Chryseobacterium sp. B21-037 TaxID=2926038 RepID=UPI002358F22D|nr:hypothetical protein [Chryseobacterium sp. B21-037]MDC8107133.1 hypothetical protein [Chryseobacterium sp. B21-037]WBV56327.1 hypothetical protein PFY10_19240 [Chryseobacterium daecheongense]